MNTNYSKEIPDKWKPMSKIFQCLGDEHRQRILLCFEPGEVLTPTQISDVSTLSRPAVSHHLGILHDAGILTRTKISRQIYYKINVDYIEGFFTDVLDYTKGLKAKK